MGCGSSASEHNFEEERHEPDIQIGYNTGTNNVGTNNVGIYMN